MKIFHRLFGFCILAGLLTGCALGNSAPEASANFPMPSTPAVQRISYAPYLATASSSLPDSAPFNAIDADPETIWNSGSGPEQWIQFDLGAPTTVRKIRLIVSQYPEGETVHQIWAGADENSLTLVHEFNGFTEDSDMLEFKPTVPVTNIRYIKIVTTQSTSWVAWREIEVIGE